MADHLHRAGGPAAAPRRRTPWRAAGLAVLLAGLAVGAGPAGCAVGGGDGPGVGEWFTPDPPESASGTSARAMRIMARAIDDPPALVLAQLVHASSPRSDIVRLGLALRTPEGVPPVDPEFLDVSVDGGHVALLPRDRQRPLTDEGRLVLVSVFPVDRTLLDRLAGGGQVVWTINPDGEAIRVRLGSRERAAIREFAGVVGDAID